MCFLFIQNYPFYRGSHIILIGKVKYYGINIINSRITLYFRSHLNNRQIVTKNPEEIRGGGLLRYCNLITRGFKVIEDDNTNKLQTLERFHRTLNYRGSRIRSSFEMSVAAAVCVFYVLHSNFVTK